MTSPTAGRKFRDLRFAAPSPTQRELLDAHALLHSPESLHDRLLSMPEPTLFEMNAATFLAVIGR
jgi:hypothetical protein